ncbi:MAG: sulfite exporter TauE/SafE family protein [Nocardioidaceae bacterium]|nr:sulfite exporter TauE/SafE family protein [Nocardioidaceae bacterium]MDQ3166754.1 sulfite exporter TauE/SafE family protein [Actinomycetota bacterium]
MTPIDTTTVLIALAALLIGMVVGMTGMGGGALMTPALIFLRVDPTVAIANDLVAAAIYKSVGAGVHWREGSPNLRLAMWLGVGSVPCAFAGAFIISAVGSDDKQQDFVKVAIGIALLIAATTYAFRIFVNLREVKSGRARQDPDPHIRPLPTIAVGAIGGGLVGLTSVGSGSVIMVTLLLLYPGLQAVRLVGTDLVQAVPLVMAAAISHVIVSGVDWSVLLPLVIGATPGIYVGSKVANRMPQTVIRRGIVFLLFITGLNLLGVNPIVALLIGVIALVAGTFAWRALRARYTRLAADSDKNEVPANPPR